MSSAVFAVIVTAYWPYVVTDGGWKLARSMIACCIWTTATRKSTTTMRPTAYRNPRMAARLPRLVERVLQVEEHHPDDHGADDADERRREAVAQPGRQRVDG